MKPVIETLPPGTSAQVYRRLLAYVRPLWGFFLLSIIGFGMYAASNALFVDLLGQLVDLIESASTMTAAERLYIPLMVLALVLLRGTGGFLGSFFMEYVANHVIHRLRCQLLERFLLIPIRFYDRNSSGHLLSTVTFNITQVNAAVSNALATVLREGLMVVALLYMLFSLNWKLTLMFLAVTPVISLLVLYASRKFRKHSTRIQNSMGDVTQALSETLKGMRVVRTFGAEQQAEKRFREVSRLNLRQNLKLAFTSALATPVIQFVVASTLALLIWLAMSPVAMQDVSSGEFVSFITAAGLLLQPIRQLTKINAAIQRGLAAAQSVFELLDEEAERDKGQHSSPTLRGEVEFSAVSFRYQENSEPVLRDISFHCAPGKSVAIVGKSGSGKTTLVNLLPRFYELQQGEILIDGVPHVDYHLHNLRSHIALVSQQVVLFNGTIRDNIAYGELQNRPDEEVLEALRNANALEFVEQLPEGINSIVGDDGILLSGGQRQRLAIARAPLKNAPILILDEATSALDSESERYIQSALDTLMKGRTTFIIAHRLSTIENADHILVMSKGQIVEQGTHSELLARGGQYARLHQVQFADI